MNKIINIIISLLLMFLIVKVLSYPFPNIENLEDCKHYQTDKDCNANKDCIWNNNSYNCLEKHHNNKHKQHKKKHKHKHHHNNEEIQPIYINIYNTDVQKDKSRRPNINKVYFDDVLRSPPLREPVERDDSLDRLYQSMPRTDTWTENGWSYMNSKYWSVPQQRKPICIGNNKCPVCPVESLNKPYTEYLGSKDLQ